MQGSGLSADSVPFVPVNPLELQKIELETLATGVPPITGSVSFNPLEPQKIKLETAESPGLPPPGKWEPARPLTLVMVTYHTLAVPGKLLEGLLVSGCLWVHNYLYRVVLQGPAHRCKVTLENHQGYPLAAMCGMRFYGNTRVYSSWSLSGHDFSDSYQSLVPNPSGQKYWNLGHLLGQTKIDPLILQIILRVASD